MNCSSETKESKWSYNFIIEMLSLACHNYNKKAVNHILAATFLCQLNTTSGIREDREEESAFRSGKNPWYEIICPGQYLYWWRIIFHALLRNLSILHLTCFEQWNNRSFYFSLQGNSHNTTIMGKKTVVIIHQLFFAPVLTFASVLHGRHFPCQLELSHLVTRVIF